MKDTISRILLITVMVYGIFLIGRIDLNSADKLIYTHYTTSIVEDFDFNITNQIPTKELWNLTETYNYPDMHPNGASVFWAPFFSYAKISSILFNMSLPKLYSLAQLLSSVCFTLLSVFILLATVKKRSTVKNIRIWMIITVFSFPLFLFSVLRPENVDVLGLLLSSVLISYYLFLRESGTKVDCFVWGVLLGLGVATKLDVAFYSILAVDSLVSNKQLAIAERFKKFSLFVAPALGVLSLVLLNEYIKFGRVVFGYLDTINTEYYLLWDTLFSHAGYVYNSPVLILYVLGFLISWKSDHHLRQLHSLLFAIPLIKIAVESFTYLHTEGYGRHLLTDIPVIFFFIIKAVSWSQTHGRRVHFLFTAVAIIGMLWNMFQGFCELSNYDSFFFKGSCHQQFGDILRDTLNFIQINEAGYKIVFLPLVIILSIVFLIFKRSNPVKVLRQSAIFMIAMYVVFTAGNYLNNQSNSKRYDTEGLYKKSLISTGPEMWFLFENAGSLERSIQYYQVAKMPEEIRKRQRILEKYLETASTQIKDDPEGFLLRMRPNRTEPVFTKEFWNDN